MIFRIQIFQSVDRWWILCASMSTRCWKETRNCPTWTNVQVCRRQLTSLCTIEVDIVKSFVVVTTALKCSDEPTGPDAYWTQLWKWSKIILKSLKCDYRSEIEQRSVAVGGSSNSKGFYGISRTQIAAISCPYRYKTLKARVIIIAASKIFCYCRKPGRRS